jgi:predicted MFS family arabinose efflux permease
VSARPVAAAQGGMLAERPLERWPGRAAGGVDGQLLLAVYYAGRGLSLLVVSQLFAASPQPSMLVFILFYGLDWVATVPPTVALCRQYYGEAGPVVFGWVFASHQVGAAIAATAAGLTRDHLGTYGPVWYVAGGICLLAASFSARLPSPAASQPLVVSQRRP